MHKYNYYSYKETLYNTVVWHMFFTSIQSIKSMMCLQSVICAEFVQLPIIQLTTSDFCDLRIELKVLSCREVNHWPILPHTISLLITWKNKIRIPCNDNICAVNLHAEQNHTARSVNKSSAATYIMHNKTTNLECV